MTEIITFLAIALLFWMAYKLYQAKQYNAFIDWLNSDVKEQLLAQLKQEMQQGRSEIYPNKDCHIELALHYYKQYPVRIFEAAFARKIISEQWLNKASNKRHASHLLFIQGSHRLINPAPATL